MDKFKFGQHSRASNSKADSQILPNIKLVKDSMTVLFICKFHNEMIKNKNVELVRDLMSVLVTCKIEDNLIKSKGISCPQHFFQALKGK